MSATPATKALDKAKVGYTLHSYDHDPKADSYGEEAAQALGVEPARVYKTLLAAVEGVKAPAVVAVVPVAGRLDLKALAAALGGKRAAMADPTAAERLTGYVLGGISPLGQKRQLPTVVDDSLQQWPTVFCSAGKRGLEIELEPAELIRLTAAVVAPIAG